METPGDVLAIEQSGSYRGIYFVLMGHLSPIDGIGPAEIGLDTFQTRVIEDGVDEVILATNPTVEGEATAHYIAQQVKAMHVAVSSLARGVPMGGELSKVGSKAPRFLILANKDALGANLDRIQVIKGWVDNDGKTHDKVFDVAWAGERQPGPDGKLPPVGNTVDVATATYRNSIGSPELAAVWADPEFNPDQRALYYARVLEIPTPRWTTFDSVRAGLPLLQDKPATIQERAWSSPIWYRP